MKKLSAIGIRRLMLATLIALHSNATTRIRTSSGLSQYLCQDMGLRLGCVLVPLLFILFILDLSAAFDMHTNFDLPTLLLITSSVLITLYYLLYHL